MKRTHTPFIEHSFVHERTYTHIRMMHQEISMEQTARILSKLATDWIERFDRDYFDSKDRKEVSEAIEYLFKILYHVLLNLECGCPADILVPMLMYADKYVSKFGINHCQLFNLLLTRYFYAPSHFLSLYCLQSFLCSFSASVYLFSHAILIILLLTLSLQHDCHSEVLGRHKQNIQCCHRQDFQLQAEGRKFDGEMVLVWFGVQAFHD